LIPGEAVTAGIGLKANAIRECLTAARFGLVGAAATIVHVSVAWTLIVNVDTPVLLANLIAFALAFGVSFVGNYVWTFRVPGRPHRAFARFVVIALSAFAANNVLLVSMLSLNCCKQSTAAVGAAAVVPAVTFLGSRLWGFRQHPSRDDPRDLR
jgi:putative flippase GtrA